MKREHKEATNLSENTNFYGAIETDESCKRYKIKIDGYVAYLVSDESFAQENEGEEDIGNLFRSYTKSKFLSLFFIFDEYRICRRFV